MKTIIFLVATLLFFSCGGKRTNVTMPTEMWVKDTVVNDSVNKPPVAKADSVVKEPEQTEESNPTELSQEEAKAINNAVSNVEIKSQNMNYSRPKSTYAVKRTQQVSEILAILYESKMKALQVNGIPESVISDEFRKFFTITYCDNDVLKILDEYCGTINENGANKIKINFESIFGSSSSKSSRKITIKK